MFLPQSTVASWCNWLTRRPLKAESSGSIPDDATKSPSPNIHQQSIVMQCLLFTVRTAVRPSRISSYQTSNTQTELSSRPERSEVEGPAVRLSALPNSSYQSSTPKQNCPSGRRTLLVDPDPVISHLGPDNLPCCFRNNRVGRFDRHMTVDTVIRDFLPHGLRHATAFYPVTR
jgi:hypothetical protein